MAKIAGLRFAEVPGLRFTLDWWKVYLDSCATYHTFFITEFLGGIYTSKTVMNGSCNAGTVSTGKKGWFDEFEVWYNKYGMANLLSVPMLEEAGYTISTHTQGDWVVTSPNGTTMYSNGTQECAVECHILTYEITKRESV